MKARCAGVVPGKVVSTLVHPEAGVCFGVEAGNA